MYPYQYKHDLLPSVSIKFLFKMHKIQALKAYRKFIYERKSENADMKSIMTSQFSHALQTLQFGSFNNIIKLLINK